MGIPMSVGGELGSPRTSVDMGIPMSVEGELGELGAVAPLEEIAEAME